jgi:hypothetical protein
VVTEATGLAGGLVAGGAPRVDVIESGSRWRQTPPMFRAARAAGFLQSALAFRAAPSHQTFLRASVLMRTDLP